MCRSWKGQRDGWMEDLSGEGVSGKCTRERKEWRMNGRIGEGEEKWRRREGF